MLRFDFTQSIYAPFFINTSIPTVSTDVPYIQYYKY